MPTPLAICLENLAAGSAPRFVRCVACAGGRPGLYIDERGAPLWMNDEGATCELWVSADERLILFRRSGGGPVRVRRELRSLDVPEAKPVVLLDGDRIDVGGRALRVHVHGPATGLHAPAPLPDSSAGALGRAAATAALLGAAFGAADCGKSAPDAQASPDGANADRPSTSSPGFATDAVLYVPMEAGVGARVEQPTRGLDRPDTVRTESRFDGDAPGRSETDVPAGASADAALDGPAGTPVEVFDLAFPGDADDARDVRGIDDARRIEVRSRPPTPGGALTVVTQPWTMVYVDGRRVRPTPLLNYELAPGQHRILLLNEELGIRHTETVTVQAGRTTMIRDVLDSRR